MVANLDQLGQIEWLLRTRKYTEAEKDKILYLAMHGTDQLKYDEIRCKFLKKVTTFRSGLQLNSWWEDLFTQGERNEFAM